MPKKTVRDTVIFFDIAYSYELVEKLAHNLETNHSIGSKFLSLSSYKTDYLRKQGVDSLYLDVTRSSKSQRKKGRDLIHHLEKLYPDYRLSLSLKRDRFLRWLPRTQGRNLLYAAAYHINNILSESKISLIIGEISTAIEYLFYFSSKSKNIPYRHLLNLPSQTPLITLFDHEHSAGSVPINLEKNQQYDDGINYETMCHRVKTKPSYLMNFISKFKLVYSPNDYRTSLYYKSRYLVKPFYFLFYYLLEKLSATDIDANSKTVFFPLHVQPESTPDFVSIFYSDQFDLIQNLSQAAPDTINIYVKEHPNMLSMRNPFKMIRMIANHNVRLLRRDMPSKHILQKVDSVVTVAGTIAIQAAAFGKPTMVFSNIYYNELKNVIDGRKYVSLSQGLASLMKAAPPPMSTHETETWLRNYGMPGFIHDPRIVPEVVNDKNIQNIACLISNFLIKYNY